MTTKKSPGGVFRHVYATPPGGLCESGVSLVQALRAYAALRPRWGYRCLLLLPRREGRPDNHKSMYRHYRQQGLQSVGVVVVERLQHEAD
jgi:hypothetical protein